MKLEVSGEGSTKERNSEDRDTKKSLYSPRNIRDLQRGLTEDTRAQPGLRRRVFNFMHSSSLPSRYGVYGVSSSERNVVGLRSREISRDFWRATDVQGVGRITLFGYSIMRCTRFKREVVESEIFRVEVTMQMIHG